MKTVYFLLLILFLFTGNLLFALSDNDILQQANEYYGKGEYDKAIELFIGLLNDDNPQASLLYNIGNTYYKLNNLPKAIAYYKKALLLSPRDKDIRKNLKYARSLVALRVEDKRNWYIRKTDELLSYIRDDELILGALFFFTIALFLIIFIILSPENSKLLKKAVLLCSLGVLFALGVLLLKIYFFEEKNPIILKNKAEIYHNPYGAGEVAFSLVPGIEGEIIQFKDNWVRIKLLNGNEGWVDSKFILKCNEI